MISRTQNPDSDLVHLVSAKLDEMERQLLPMTLPGDQRGIVKSQLQLCAHSVARVIEAIELHHACIEPPENQTGEMPRTFADIVTLLRSAEYSASSTLDAVAARQTLRLAKKKLQETPSTDSRLRSVARSLKAVMNTAFSI